MEEKVGFSARGGHDRACEGRCRDAIHANQAWALYHRCVAHKKPQATADPVRCAGEAARAAGQGLQQQLHEVSDLCVEGGEVLCHQQGWGHLCQVVEQRHPIQPSQ